MGNDSYSSKSAAKTRFKNAGMGLAGALISFLVLQTIDPRLVQINTTIEPICPKGAENDPSSVCYNKDVSAFKSQLLTDLEKLNSEDRARILGNETELKKVKETIEALEAKKVDVGTLNPEEEVRLEAFKQSERRMESENVLLTGRNVGSRNFTRAIKELHNPINFYTPGIFQKPGQLTPEAIVDQEGIFYQINTMARYEAKLKDLGDVAGATKLGIRRQMYLEQIGEEQELVKNIRAYNYAGESGKKQIAVTLKKELEAYSKPESSTSGRVIDSELAAEYENIKKQRIEIITKTLANQPIE
jgi:hypothetical protein